MGAPTVSVAIVTYDSAGVIGPCLASLPAAAGDVSYEVIVVDNGSKDGTLKVLAETLPEARVVVPGDNLGFGRANNEGAAASSGRYIWLLNPDTVARPGSLASLVAVLDATPDACAATPRLVDAEGREAMTFGDFPTVGWSLAALAPRRSGAASGVQMRRPLPGTPEPFDADAVCAAALLVRRECWEKVGGFDPDFFMYFEDTDLSLRLHRAGGRVLVDPGAEVVHLEGASLEGASATAAAYFHEGLLVYLRKHAGAGATFVARTWLAAASAFYVATGALLGALFPGVRANREVHRARLRLALRGTARPGR